MFILYISISYIYIYISYVYIYIHHMYIYIYITCIYIYITCIYIYDILNHVCTVYLYITVFWKPTYTLRQSQIAMENHHRLCFVLGNCSNYISQVPQQTIGLMEGIQGQGRNPKQRIAYNLIQFHVITEICHH